MESFSTSRQVRKILGCDAMTHELLDGQRVLPFGEPVKLLVPDCSRKAPFGGEPSKPYASYSVAFRVFCQTFLVTTKRLVLSYEARVRVGT